MKDAAGGGGPPDDARRRVAELEAENARLREALTGGGDGRAPAGPALDAPTLDGLAATAPLVLWSAGADGRLVRVSPYGQTYSGRPAEAALGDGWLAAVHPDHRAGAAEAVGRAVAAGGVYEVEAPIRRADGAYRRFLLRGLPARDAAGRVTGWHGLGVDVDGLKGAEGDVRAAEAGTRLAVEAAGLGTWDFEPTTGRLVWNARHRALFGLPPEAEVAYTTFLDGCHPDDRPRMEAAVARATRRDGGAFHEEFRVVGLRDGVERRLVTRGRAFFEDGRCVRFIGVVMDVTDRRRVEEERDRLLGQLAAERARFAAMVETMPAGVLFAEAPSGRIVFGNPRVERLLRHPVRPSPDVAAYREWEAYHPDGRRVRGEEYPLARALGGETVIGAEVLYRRGDGSTSWLSISGAPVRDAVTGEINGALAMFVDVDRERRAEEELRRLNATLAAAVEEQARGRERLWRLSGDPMVVADFDGRFLAVNPAWTAVLGWEEAEILATPFMEIVHPDDRERTRAELASLASGRATHRFENRYRRKDGAYRWLAWNGVPEDGRMYCVARDVTVEKEAVRALRDALARVRSETRGRERAEAEYAALYARAPVPLHSLDADGRLLGVSDRWLEFLGVGTRDEALGRPITDFMTEETAHTFRERAWPALLAAGEPRDVEYRLVRGSGEVADVLASERVERDAAGRFVRAVAALTDVTQRRRAEAALLQARKMEAVGQLTGGIAHDFNNLLTAVVGGLEMIRDRAGDERLRRLADGSLKAAWRGTRLTGQLLAFSRTQKLSVGPVEIDRLLGGMDDLLTRTIGRPVEVRTRLGAGGAHALADATQLELAVLNLAINARDAMPGGGRLTVATGLRTFADGEDDELAAGDYAVIAVADEGDGMTDEVRARAFDPFFTTKPVGRGTGLGLSQAYGIVRQCGGTMRIESAPGRGTTVRVFLPRASDAPPAAAPDADPGGDGGRRATILVVDDDPEVRRFLSSTLRAFGHRVIEAADGPAGLARLKDAAPDLLLLDVVMPGMNGAEVARAARALRPDLRIVFATGRADAALDGVDGAARVLRKPFRLSELTAAIAGALADRSAAVGTPAEA